MTNLSKAASTSRTVRVPNSRSVATISPNQDQKVTNDTLATQVAELLRDFRLGEITPISSERVMAWTDQVVEVCQWLDDDFGRQVLMEALVDVLRVGYWSSDRG